MTLNLTLTSDLHVDHNQPKIVWKKGDVLLIAGDTANTIGAVHKFVNKAARHFDKVFVIMGNHENYANASRKRTIDQTALSLRNGLAKNVSLLDPTNPHETYEGVHFVGTCGWYSFDAVGDPMNNRLRWYEELNDARYMGFDDKGYPYIEQKCIWDRAEHEARIIDETLQGITDDAPIVVMTHMPPIRNFLRNDPRFAQTNGYYYNSHLDKVAEKHGDRIGMWLSGHSHDRNSHMRDGTWFVANPRGYPKESAREWHPLRVIVHEDGNIFPE